MWIDLIHTPGRLGYHELMQTAIYPGKNPVKLRHITSGSLRELAVRIEERQGRWPLTEAMRRLADQGDAKSAGTNEPVYRVKWKEDDRTAAMLYNVPQDLQVDKQALLTWYTRTHDIEKEAVEIEVAAYNSIDVARSRNEVKGTKT